MFAESFFNIARILGAGGRRLRQADAQQSVVFSPPSSILRLTPPILMEYELLSLSAGFPPTPRLSGYLALGSLPLYHSTILPTTPTTVSGDSETGSHLLAGYTRRTRPELAGEGIGENSLVVL